MLVNWTTAFQARVLDGALAEGGLSSRTVIEALEQCLGLPETRPQAMTRLALASALPMSQERKVQAVPVKCSRCTPAGRRLRQDWVAVEALRPEVSIQGAAEGQRSFCLN